MIKYVLSLFIIIILFSSCDKNPAGPSNYSNYFPLNVNKTWMLEHEKGLSNLAYKIWDKRTIKGHTYYAFGENEKTATLIRKDDKGRIWTHNSERDQIYLDFTQKDDQHYLYTPTGDSTEAAYQVTVAKNVYVNLINRSFDDCISFYFENKNRDEETYWYVFAPNVGIVMYGNSYVGRWRLISEEK